ncbi:MAG: hypothetical protein LBT40_01130 [Deltaproteobacteria bacterium]|nr:hypothetical protein [Deltaproteobacteria bacterium]
MDRREPVSQSGSPEGSMHRGGPLQNLAAPSSQPGSYRCRGHFSGHSPLQAQRVAAASTGTFILLKSSERSRVYSAPKRRGRFRNSRFPWMIISEGPGGGCRRRRWRH